MDSLTALRKVLDEYDGETYELGRADCISIVARYADLLEIPHDWKPELSLLHGHTDAQPVRLYRGLVKAFGEPLRDLRLGLVDGRFGELPDGLQVGDVILAVPDETDIPTAAIATGRGAAAMTEKLGLACLPWHSVGIRAAWRIG